VQNLLSSRLLSRNLKINIYRTIITWSLTLREERRLRVFESRVLKRLFGSMRDEVTGEWRKLRNEELHNLYSSPNIVRVIKSRRMRSAKSIERMGRGEACTGIWWGNPRERDNWGDSGIVWRIMLR
jgi:hypothetical protein